jgi:hypothetical protein
MVDAIDLLRRLVAAAPPQEPISFSGLAPVGTVNVLQQMIITAGQLFIQLVKCFQRNPTT